MKTPENLAHLSQTEFSDKSWKGAYWGNVIGLDYYYLIIPLDILSEIPLLLLQNLHVKPDFQSLNLIFSFCLFLREMYFDSPFKRLFFVFL